MTWKLPVTAKSGFTLAEVLTALCISVLMTTALSAVLMSALMASERARANFSKYQALRVFFLVLERDLRSTMAYGPLPFEGKEDEIRFPGRAKTPVRIAYRFEAGRLLRSEADLKESWNRSRAVEKTFLPGLKAIHFEFPYRRGEGGTVFLPFWLEEPHQGIPQAVKVTLELKDGARFSKLISLPQGRLGFLPEDGPGAARP